jgi:2-dehydro-3-deoxygluconokinase
MNELMDYVDIVIANEEDAEMVFGIESGSDITGGDLEVAGYRKVAAQLIEKFDLELVGSHLRESHSASDNGWMVVLYDGQNFVKSEKYNIHIVDRVGGGDSFAGGLIYSLLNGKELQDAAEFGAAASCLKQTIHGDMNMVSVDEVNTIAEGNISGRVKR